MKNYSDTKLMNLIVERNTEAFKLLYQRYEIQVFNFIFRYTGSRELAQDLLQETFTRVWFAAHAFDLRKGNFKGWVFKIAFSLITILLVIYLIQSKISLLPIWQRLSQYWLVQTIGSFGVILILFFCICTFITLSLAPILIMEKTKMNGLHS